MSDHSPVVLDTSPLRWGPIPFRFENAWLEYKHFSRDFEKWWKEVTITGWEGYKWMLRLQKIKPLLNNWNTEVFGDLRFTALNNRLKKLDRLEGLGNWSVEYKGERETLKKKLNEILVKKEISVRQKLKI